MKVCIDAGHYTGYNAGAVPGYYEGNAMWILAGFLQSALEKYGIEVINTRQSMDKDLSLDLRGRTAADNGADLFLSLHSNAASVNARGTEIYYSIHRTESKKLADALGMAIAQ
jgi:N-acetylmuramoyl-L-alanine amidase